MEKEKLFLEIGLTKYEIKAYLELLKYDEVEAKVIYHEAKIPFGKIYSVLDSLARKGFLDVIETTPKKYKAIKPDMAFMQYQKMQEGWLTKKLNLLKESMSNLLKEFSSSKPQKKNEEIFWTTKVSDEDLKKINKTLYYQPIKSVYLLLHFVNVKNVRGIINQIQKALENNVEFKLIMTKESLNFLIRNEKDCYELIKKNIKVRIIKEIYSYFGIIDKEAVVFFQQNPINKNKLTSAMIIWNKDLAKNFEEEFEKVWERAKEVRI